MFTADNEAGDFRRNWQNNLELTAVLRAQITANNKIIFVMILIIVQYLFKFLKIIFLNTYEGYEENLRFFWIN